MQSVSKFKLNGGLKRIVSTLICVMMVLVTFPMHMLKNTVSAAGGDPINLTLGSEGSIDGSPGNGNEVSNWMNGQLADLTGKGDINITLSNDITVASEVTAESLPTMSAADGRKYLFDFIDGRFNGKTITIDGKGKTVKIGNANLFFLNLQNCKVILKNIVIDGGWLGFGENWSDNGGIKRDGSFINVAKSESDNSSELEIGEGTTIQNCENFSSNEAYGGAIYASGALTINGGSITNCNCAGAPSGSSSCYGGAIYASGALTINGGIITNCNCTGISPSSSSYLSFNCNGGAIYNTGGSLTINGGSIKDCTCTCNCTCTESSSSSCNGGAIYSYKGMVTINDGVSITNCNCTCNCTCTSTSYSGASCYCAGGAICASFPVRLTINDGVSITNCNCTSSSSSAFADASDSLYSYGGAIYNSRGPITINGGSIKDCNCTCTSSSSSSRSVCYGGAIYNSGGLITINGGGIKDCTCTDISTASSKVYGGAVYSDYGTVTINRGSIKDCSVSGNGESQGDAIYNGANNGAAVYLPPIDFPSSELPFLTIKLPNGLDNATHNTNPEATLNYMGIYSTKGAIENPNRKIEFFDSESKPLDGFAFGHVPENSQNVQETEWISVPDSVPNRSGYKFALSYINNSAKTSIDVSDDGKFTLTQGMLDTAANGVIKVYVNYDKLYTEQYVNHGEFVGIIRAKRA